MLKLCMPLFRDHLNAGLILDDREKQARIAEQKNRSDERKYMIRHGRDLTSNHFNGTPQYPGANDMSGKSRFQTVNDSQFQYSNASNRRFFSNTITSPTKSKRKGRRRNKEAEAYTLRWDPQQQLQREKVYIPKFQSPRVTGVRGQHAARVKQELQAAKDWSKICAGGAIDR